jgi:hypothetical protein
MASAVAADARLVREVLRLDDERLALRTARTLSLASLDTAGAVLVTPGR